MRLVLIDNKRAVVEVYDNKLLLATFEIEDPKQPLEPEVIEQARTAEYKTRA